MTILECILTGIIWIVMGLLICNKAGWFVHYDKGEEEHILACVATVIVSPIVFLFDFINRFFIQKWH